MPASLKDRTVLVVGRRRARPERGQPGHLASRLRHQPAAVPEAARGPDGARAFADDAPGAEIHLIEGGHFLLESDLDTAAGYIRSFLEKTDPGRIR